jgi:urease accessory protein
MFVMKKSQFWQYLVGSHSLLSASAFVLTLLIPSVASAHTGVGDSTGFLHGLEHPIGGLDHVLAMVSVGLWAAQIGGTALWVVPSVFVLTMAGSSVLGHFGLPLPGVEQGIVASDFILGLLILVAPRLPLAVSIGIVSILAIFHGYAHGAEMPANASGLNYGMGFILATAALHLTGIGMGLGIDSLSEHLSQRLQPTFRQELFRSGGVAIIIGATYILIINN